ncbi:hypothetical protein A2924_03875 [Candidatus Giovannonibacteria bacterium RIFCSPLOWO2_01_FULL_44_16]|uniref:Uncharacterized protein n=1 Tax=Candidatus Giovannonibacteria bacterium RIFCSPLOWO2_01_FULL_44_16 TaxID=1798348 RepID=A0A1F5X5F7_9BACT|nr:MAG: hypothetical protein A2924_03875 [Candidatus Giovannonibacteria bacterium RIFCSPLOWO2_01_FULL_44_16]
MSIKKQKAPIEKDRGLFLRQNSYALANFFSLGLCYFTIIFPKKDDFKWSCIGHVPATENV